MRKNPISLQFVSIQPWQADENLFHPDADKLFTANQGLAEKLREMVREQSPKVAQRLAEVDIDFLPMIAAWPCSAWCKEEDHIKTKAFGR